MTRIFGGREWNIEKYGSPQDGAPLIVLLAGNDELSDTFYCKLASENVPPLRIAVPTEVDWDADFSPWPAECGGRKFSGGADIFGESVDEMCRTLRRELHPVSTYIVGYSLGGLAAMYLHVSLRCFDGCGSCSGSMWYPGWYEYLQSHEPKGAVYLSLGGKEKNSHDSIMATVADATERTRHICERTADKVYFRGEPGGHFRDPDGRLARAIKWLCG